MIAAAGACFPSVVAKRFLASSGSRDTSITALTALLFPELSLLTPFFARDPAFELPPLDFLLLVVVDTVFFR